MELKDVVAVAIEDDMKLIQSKGKEARCGGHKIQRVNNYHSKLKDFLENFRGVFSKYLNHYLIWHNFANCAKNTFDKKREGLLRFAFVTPKKITNNQLSNISPLPEAC